jgi:hypothetical protein
MHKIKMNETVTVAYPPANLLAGHTYVAMDDLVWTLVIGKHATIVESISTDSIPPRPPMKGTK